MCYNACCVDKVLVILTDQRLGFSGDQCTTTCCNVRGTIDETDGDSSWQDVLPCKKMFFCCVPVDSCYVLPFDSC